MEQVLVVEEATMFSSSPPSRQYPHPHPHPHDDCSGNAADDNDDDDKILENCIREGIIIVEMGVDGGGSSVGDSVDHDGNENTDTANNDDTSADDFLLLDPTSQQIRRTRLFFRPIVVLLFGFFVFRNRPIPFGTVSFFPIINHLSSQQNRHNQEANDDDVDNDYVKDALSNITRAIENESENKNPTSTTTTWKNNNVGHNGWEVTDYPNPELDPDRCGIASYVTTQATSTTTTTANHPEIDTNTPNTKSGKAIGTVSHKPKKKTKTENDDDDNGSDNGNRKTVLRLCDPDSVFGGIYLTRIAEKMKDFSNQFSNTATTTATAISCPGRSSSTSTAAATTTTATATRHPNSSSNNHNSSNHSSSSSSSSEEEGEEGIRCFSSHTEGVSQERRQGIAIAVATVRKMNIPAILKQEQPFYAYNYEDEDDMVNDAAQLFAKKLHAQWWQNTRSSSSTRNNDQSSIFGHQENRDDVEEMPFYRGDWMGIPTITTTHDKDDHNVPFYQSITTTRTNNNNKNNDKKDVGTSKAESDDDVGILLFLSMEDRVSFITTGGGNDYLSTLLPWWRVEHVMSQMKPTFHHRQYGDAVVTAIEEITALLLAGPPTPLDRVHDFVARFGVVIAFALLTFLFGAWGEYRDRQKRTRYIESRSQLTAIDRDKARD